MGWWKRSLAVVLALVVGLSLAGCGSGHGVKVVRGTIEIGHDVSDASLRQSVLGIKIGTDAQEVRTRLGKPFAKVAAGPQTCWAYHASQGGSATSMSLTDGSSLDAIDFCMNPAQRVKRILIGVHG